jgi:hypothetical protein
MGQLEKGKADFARYRELGGEPTPEARAFLNEMENRR